MARKGKVSPPTSADPVRSTSPSRTQKSQHGLRSLRYFSTAVPVQDGPDEGMGVKPTEEDSSESDPKAVQDQKQEAEEGVHRAIKGLERMERRLMRAVKIQQREVQKSKVPERRDNPVEHAFKPRPTKNIDPDDAINQPSRKRRRAAAKGELMEDEYEDDEGTDGDHGAAAGPRKTTETSDKGGARPPAVNSPYLPLPWKGRLGYACLNTYLRNAKPSVFSSRTCRMSSIIDHRHPLQDPSQPPHLLKNKPDKTKKADEALGRKFVQDIGLANARDIVKMIRWNDKYNIKFMRLSSEMFPFASHEKHGYKLEPFAATVLADAGRTIAELGHRVTMHPGQYTQLGSPRKEVIQASVRDLVYHDELLSLLGLPPQLDRDAVLILHMGGTYGDKAATLSRFRDNYKNLLSDSVRARLVLENDDVSWSVHDLLPVCEELNIPLVLDWHHHNIVFDSSVMREGTLDIADAGLQDRIRATWTRKGITQKMHYSEPESGAVTLRERRKHSPRVATFPPCRSDMDLMIEAKDKEQAVFELMRNFKLPGFERIATVVPYERDDDERVTAVIAASKGSKAAQKNGKAASGGASATKRNGRGKKQKTDLDDERDILLGDIGEGEKAPSAPEHALETGGSGSSPVGHGAQSGAISPDAFGMGGPQNRVYWPPGMEEWIHPRKRDTKKEVRVDGDESIGGE